MIPCEWKGGCNSAASRQLGPFEVCATHFRASLDSIAEQAAASPKVKTWVRRILFSSDPDGNEILWVQPPRPARERRDDTQSLVYFAQREQRIKIGISSNVPKRLVEISRGSSMLPGMTLGPVELLGTTAGGRPQEKRLHLQFRHLRVGGEWFRDTPELREAIEEICGGER